MSFTKQLHTLLSLLLITSTIYASGTKVVVHMPNLMLCQQKDFENNMVSIDKNELKKTLIELNLQPQQNSYSDLCPENRSLTAKIGNGELLYYILSNTNRRYGSSDTNIKGLSPYTRPDTPLIKFNYYKEHSFNLQALGLTSDSTYEDFYNQVEVEINWKSNGYRIKKNPISTFNYTFIIEDTTNSDMNEEAFIRFKQRDQKIDIRKNNAKKKKDTKSKDNRQGFSLSLKKVGGLVIVIGGICILIWYATSQKKDRPINNNTHQDNK